MMGSIQELLRSHKMYSILCERYVKLLIYLLLSTSQSFCQEFEGAEGLVMIPNTGSQIVKEGTNLTMACIYHYEDESDKEFNNISWTLPDVLAKNLLTSGIHHRLHKTFHRNNTHMTSTMTLRNLRTKDTGYFTCNVYSSLYYRWYRIRQYVLVFNEADLVLIDDKLHQEYSSKQGDSIQIPCRPTHPNVTFQLIRNSQITAKGYMWEHSKNLLSDPDSKWSLDPERGLTLKNTTIGDTGQYQCVGTMNNNTDWEYFQIYVKGIELERIGDAEDPLEGSNVTLICRTHVEREFASPPEWSYQLVHDTGETLKVINDTNTNEDIPINSQYYNEGHRSSKAVIYGRERTWRYYESRQELIGVTLNTNITFQCKANKNPELMFKKISFKVKEMNNDPVVNLIHLDKGRAKNLTCNYSLQRNKILWFKDDKEYSGLVHSSGNFSILPLNGLMNEIGVYSCRWNNSLGQPRYRNFTVLIGSASGSTHATAIPLSANLIALIVIIGIGVKLYLDKKRQVFPGAKKLLEGNRLHSNIDSRPLSMEEQIDALPYDKRWEFPRHRLALGIQLGAGCFGRVVKAEAVGMDGSGKHAKTVAVKMVRSQTNVVALEALVSEMKILMHLASHLNVVNLLGACTKDIDKGELLLIVEYCRFGNLQAYLINHRENFINLMDDFGNMKSDNEADQIVSDYGVYERLQIKSKIPPDITITNPGPLTTEISQKIRPLELIYDPQEPQSFWQYQQDPDATLIRSVSTRDLISWSFQIARGMDYLASKKVLHGDLAARNVLLADDGVVKVADFGMARKMYLEGNYEKKGQGLMPIRWMAIESLTDRIFSSQSDVWSYGILLWELFSLGKVPYPGMEVGSELLKEIQNGYRMEKPEYATNTMGKVMTDCWKTDPKERPTFRQLQEMIHDHIESSVSSDYWSLNFPYAKLSEEKHQGSCTDCVMGQAKQTFNDNKFKRKVRALSFPAEDVC